MEVSEEPGFWNSLPVVHVRGTHYQIGKMIGETFRHQIQTYLKTSVSLNRDSLPFTATEEGTALVDKLETKSSAIFPHYMDEIRGTAEGAQVDFRKLLTLHLGYEISLVLKKKGKNQSSQEGCTTILSRNGQSTFFAHNEDVPPECVHLGYLIMADISDPSHKSEEKWMSFANPGVIVGNTFGFNNHGLIYSMNDVVQEDADIADCVPRRFMMRSLVAARSIEDVQRIFKELAPVGAGFTTNYAQLDETNSRHSLSSLEFFKSSVNVKQIEEETYCHANLYVERKEAQYPHPSSTFRRERFFSFSKGKQLSEDEILTFMSDRDNKEYPVFRDGVHPDNLATTATAFFDLGNKELRVYRGPPAVKKPVAQISLDRLLSIWNT